MCLDLARRTQPLALAVLRKRGVSLRSATSHVVVDVDRHILTSLLPRAALECREASLVFKARRTGHSPVGVAIMRKR